MANDNRLDRNKEALIVDGCEIRISYAEKSNPEYIEILKELLVQQLYK